MLLAARAAFGDDVAFVSTSGMISSGCEATSDSSTPADQPQISISFRFSIAALMTCQAYPLIDYSSLLFEECGVGEVADHL